MCAAAAKPPHLELNPRAVNAPLSVLFYDQGPSVHACSDRVTVTHGMARSIRASRWHTACHGRSARHGDTRRVTVDPRVTAFLSRTAQTAVLDPRVRFRSDSDSDSDPRPGDRWRCPDLFTREHTLTLRLGPAVAGGQETAHAADGLGKAGLERRGTGWRSLVSGQDPRQDPDLTRPRSESRSGSDSGRALGQDPSQDSPGQLEGGARGRVWRGAARS